MLPRAIFQISRDLTPKSCSILLKAPGWGYQLLGLNGGCTTRSLCQHQCGRGNLVTPEKPGKNRNEAGRRVLVALSRESPWERHGGLQGEAYLGCPSPRCQHSMVVFQWVPELSKARKVVFRRVSASKAEFPPLITPHWNGKATKSQEPGLCFGLTCRCDLVFP